MRVVVMGAGAVGAMVAFLCGHLPGAEVTLVDTNTARAQLAQQLGVSFAAPGAAKGDCDLVVHASGTAAGLDTAIALAGEEATVLELSWYGEQPVAVFVPWQGSATFQRLDAFCKGVADGLSNVLKNGHPLVLAGDGDVGGLLGIHLHEEMKLSNPVVSIDGLELKEFDYIDIGTMLESSGAVPVVIKSLIFPAAAPDRPR